MSVTCLCERKLCTKPLKRLLTLPLDVMELGLFLLPFGLPLGLFGVGDPLGSCCKKIEMG